MLKGKIAVIVVILLCLVSGVLGWVIRDKTQKETNEPIPQNTETQTPNQNVVEEQTEQNTEPQTESIEYTKVPVTDLQAKLAKLDFNNKLTSSYDGTGPEPILKVNVENGVPKLSYDIEPTLKKSYEVSSLKNVISVGITFGVQGNGEAISYYLTEDGKVYKIHDSFGSLDKAGKLIELNVNNATAIATGYIDFGDDHFYNYAGVVIKTKDNKLLTNDSHLTNGDTLVEIVEK